LRRFLSRVPSQRLRTGVRAGLVSAAATAGAITGFGVRHNDWLGPFTSLGAQVIRGFGVSNPPTFISPVTGVATHVAWMVFWGIAFAALAHRRAPVITVVLAMVVGLVAALAARSMVPAAMGAVSFAALPAAQAVLCVALMTVGLWTGRALASAD
jgi:hypothetical protein